MSFEAYKIAVKIALVENVTQGLMKMAGHFHTTDAAAKALEKRIASLGKLSLIGGGLLAAGGAGLKMLEEPLDKVTQYERYVASMRQMGLGDSQIKDARKFVEATGVINTSLLDRMRLFTESQGAFRESGKSGAEALAAAKVMMPVLGTYEVAMSTLSGAKHDAAEHSMRHLNKLVEILGGLGNPERAKEIADGAFKTAQSSGKMVNEPLLSQFAAHGGTATNQQKLRTIFGGLEPIIGELGGSSVADGLLTAYSRANGMMALPPRRLLAEMQRLGMTDASGRQQTDTLMKLQSSDAIGYAEEIMRRYAAHGITTQAERERENAIIFGRKGSIVYNKIMAQMSVIHDSLKAYDQAKGASDVVNDPANKQLLAKQAFAKKWEDFQLALAMEGGLLDLATRGLTMLGSALTGLTDIVKAYPVLTKLAITALVAGSSLMILGGSLLMIRATLGALTMLNPKLIFRAILGGAKSLIADATKFARGLWSAAMWAGRGMGSVWRWVVSLSRILLTNPIGLAIAAIAAAAFLLWNNWTEISASLKTMWAGIKEGFTRLFNGDLLGAWHTFAGVYLSAWQLFFNTLIAGINTILPKAMEISKLTFADDYHKAHASPYIAPGNPQTIQVNSVVKLDGKPIAQAVTTHQAREANRPRTGGADVDRRMTVPSIAMHVR